LPTRFRTDRAGRLGGRVAFGAHGGRRRAGRGSAASVRRAARSPPGCGDVARGGGVRGGGGCRDVHGQRRGRVGPSGGDRGLRTPVGGAPAGDRGAGGGAGRHGGEQIGRAHV